jgi:uncharacterized small protein (DUF1192 family)
MALVFDLIERAGMSKPGEAAPEDPPDEVGSPMAIADMAARIAMLRDLVDLDPSRLNSLLGTLDGFARNATVSQHASTALAVLDELEALVALLTERKAAVAGELRVQGQRRRALDAYMPRPMKP